MRACHAPCISSKKTLRRRAQSPIIPLSTGSRLFRQTLIPGMLNPSQAATDRQVERQSETADFLRPVRPRMKAGLLVLRRDAETYGAAESVRTPTADRCCHEGRQKPSMARWTKLARVEDWRGPERTLLSGSDWQDRQHQGRHGATSLRKLLPRPCPDLTGRRWEKSRRRLSFWAPLAI
ncbi:hypothetical protein ABID19_004695 [Mesorhizobium robiniae]|uniref:Uncharacterized protein n=1 Tax=Mesorhizobium robiniae TaxID=559315 RepID=A0ABV2GTN5_9HYPH